MTCGVNLPVGSSDHSSIKINVEMDQVIPDVNFSRKVYLKSCADWNAIIHDLMAISWSAIYRSPNIVECLNDHLS